MHNIERHEIKKHDTKKQTQERDSQRGFIESYFFYPTWWHKLLALMLLPITCIYALIALYKKHCSPRKHFDIKIISIGNLVSGGSGKTPFCIALVNHLHAQGYNDIFVILRGYKRHSKGCIAVSNNGAILCDVAQSGDEAMLIATQTKSSVIVSENREVALRYAQAQNAKIVILDDAYRFCFNKFDILLEPILKPYFPFMLPSGYYRFPPSYYQKCDLHIKEGEGYVRKVWITHPDSYNRDSHNRDSQICSNAESTNTNDTSPYRYLLASAIANPSRLQPFLPPNIVGTYYLPDHASFEEAKLSSLLREYNATHILMTQKDYMKCAHFALPFALLMLRMEIAPNALEEIEAFLRK